MDFKHQFISFKYIYSDWIFIWFLLFISPLNPKQSFAYNYLNPVYSLYLALLHNIIILILLFAQNANSNAIIKMILLLLCEKIIPIYVLWTVYNHKTTSLHLQQNIPFTIGLFCIYLAFLYSRNTNFCHVYEEIFYSIKHDLNKTPFFLTIHKLLGL